MKHLYIPVLATLAVALGYTAYTVNKVVSPGKSLSNPKFNDALPANSPPGGYVPVLYFYLNGKFVRVQQVAEAEPNMSKCLEGVQEVITRIMESPQAPNGGGLRGACIPIPSAPEHVISREPDRANHSPVPEVLGGHPSTTI